MQSEAVRTRNECNMTGTSGRVDKLIGRVSQVLLKHYFCCHTGMMHHAQQFSFTGYRKLKKKHNIRIAQFRHEISETEACKGAILVVLHLFTFSIEVAIFPLLCIQLEKRDAWRTLQFKPGKPFKLVSQIFVRLPDNIS